MEDKVLKYLQLAQIWLFVRSTTGLAQAQEASYAAQLEEVWDILTDDERERVETALVEEPPDESTYLAPEVEVLRGVKRLPRQMPPQTSTLLRDSHLPS